MTIIIRLLSTSAFVRALAPHLCHDLIGALVSGLGPASHSGSVFGFVPDAGFGCGPSSGFVSRLRLWLVIFCRIWNITVLAVLLRLRLLIALHLGKVTGLFQFRLYFYVCFGKLEYYCCCCITSSRSGSSL